MKKALFVVLAIGILAQAGMAFEAKLDTIEIYKGDKNGVGHNICENGEYLATEVYTINMHPMQKIKMKIVYPNNTVREENITGWREKTKQITYSYCFADVNKRNVSVTFIAPNGEESNKIDIKENLDITKALPAESWPGLLPIK
ncbi:MAG: hypothetical protein HQK65_06525 [Desulfamplus sp.]|nr:hypothetical protein [Desulfamplus sp.]